MSKNGSLKETGLSNDQKLVCSNNPRPNIWNKVEKSSEIGQGKKAKIYANTDGGPERKVDNLLVQKSYISIFPSCYIDEILVAHKAANLSS